MGGQLKDPPLNITRASSLIRNDAHASGIPVQYGDKAYNSFSLAHMEVWDGSSKNADKWRYQEAAALSHNAHPIGGRWWVVGWGRGGI